MFAEQIARMRRQAENLRKVQISVESPGEYPVKSRTPVSDVARYQNDGTEWITPSRFIERAEDAADGWEIEISKGIDMILNGDSVSSLQPVADEIAKDISDMCDRIDTGRLKRSFTGKVDTDGRH
jgi:hypothetical protein